MNRKAQPTRPGPIDPTLAGTPYTIIFWVAAIVLSGAIFRFYIDGVEWDEPRLALAELMRGEAHRPFAYRVLVPGLTKAIGLVLPGLAPTTVASGLIFLALLGFVGALRLLYTAFWAPSARLDLAVILSPVALLPLALTFRHIYDLPTLFLFTLGLALLAHRRWTAFLIVYAVGCLNKETTLFLSLVFAIWCYRSLPARDFWRLLLAQAAIYGLIRAALLWRFRNNPGGVVEFHLLDHLDVYMRLPGFTIGYAIFITIVAGVCLRNWRHKPRPLVQAALALLAVLIPLFALFGFPYEIRVFYEVFAPIYLICLPPSWHPAPPQDGRDQVYDEGKS